MCHAECVYVDVKMLNWKILKFRRFYICNREKRERERERDE